MASGLNVDEKKNGVLVHEFLETSAPDVWAAGDVAGFQDPVLGKQWRVEHWNNAFWHGEIAGANMAGQRVAYDHIPNFFSDLVADPRLQGHVLNTLLGGSSGLSPAEAGQRFHSGQPAEERHDADQRGHETAGDADLFRARGGR